MPFILLLRFLDYANDALPGPTHAELSYYSVNKIRLRIAFLSVVEDRRKLVSGIVFANAMMVVWSYIAVVNFKGFGTFWEGVGTIANPINAIFFTAAFRNYAIVLSMWAFRTPVLVGDVDNDDKAKALAIAMQEAARKHKVKMRFIQRGKILRAYFRNDDEAVLVRASA